MDLRYRPLTKEESYEQIKIIQANEPRSKDATLKIIQSMIRLVHREAQKYKIRPDLYQDIISAGIEGIIHAIPKFKISSGLSINTYIMYWVMNFMQTYVCDENRLISGGINADIDRHQVASGTPRYDSIDEDYERMRQHGSVGSGGQESKDPNAYIMEGIDKMYGPKHLDPLEMVDSQRKKAALHKAIETFTTPGMQPKYVHKYSKLDRGTELNKTLVDEYILKDSVDASLKPIAERLNVSRQLLWKVKETLQAKIARKTQEIYYGS